MPGLGQQIATGRSVTLGAGWVSGDPGGVWSEGRRGRVLSTHVCLAAHQLFQPLSFALRHGAGLMPKAVPEAQLSLSRAGEGYLDGGGSHFGAVANQKCSA